jgi:hypothetical protein
MAGQKGRKGNSKSTYERPDFRKIMNGQKPPPLPPRPRFRDVKKQLDSAPKANPFQDRLLIGFIILIIVAGFLLLLLGYFFGGSSGATPTPTRTGLLTGLFASFG